MTDFSQFYTNNAAAANSNFKETFTVETIKASQGNAALNVVPCPPKFDENGNQTNKGRCFFACGEIRGAVSQQLADKLAAKQPHGTLVISHVVNDGSDPKYPTPYNGLMLHEQAENNNTLLTL